MLDYLHGITLSKQPIEIDTLVIKKNTDAPIDLDIASIFRRYNIFEFKSPTDDLTINQYCDLMTYVYRFSSKEGVELNEITGTLFRSAYPRELFKEVKRLGGVIDQSAPGIYYLTGLSIIPTQVIVSNELEKEYAALRAVSNRTTTEDIARLLEEARSLTDQRDLDNLDATLRISILANKKLFDRILEDKNMSEELERLLQPVVDRVVERESVKAEARGEKKAIKLMAQLYSIGRARDAERAENDVEFREALYKEFGIA